MCFFAFARIDKKFFVYADFEVNGADKKCRYLFVTL